MAIFPAPSLLIIILLALSITATPFEVRDSLITLPIARRLNVSDGPISLLQHDKVRVAAIKDCRHLGSPPVTNVAVNYIAKVGVGSPATIYNLIVDTGSSNTWVGAGTAYVKTSTSINTGQPVEIDYGFGIFSGTEYTDTVTLGSGLTIAKQSIGVASNSEGFTAGVDGVLGIGPVDLTVGSLIDGPNTAIPTVVDNLYSQGTISQEVVSVLFEPTTSKTNTNGELTFGGTDFFKYTGDIGYTPITTTNPESTYWGINESITYGSTMILSNTAGIVDTSTTYIFVATDAYTKYKAETGATVDLLTGLLLVFFRPNTYTLTPNAQIWPRSLNTYIGGSSNAIYLIVTDIGTASGSVSDFVNGYTFLERFYSVYDTTNSRVGFAKTSYTDATTN
ncbi:aspartic peptidase domain-containing protein [Suillus subalutaceus]|uniref:aspartic peptidase domain-containing protein n=1 Tax=Suillus subalutaceus TaxID=48586 RepID=UPI001B87DC77|nr:aspartic peptidase domain-containing protein [Suillus subalutaceus]KAG1843018.1 aspartic peptidase domain-containing protein [Suillus subalutaceus]